ncbi:hypothetical protein BH18ACI4_BH18ACI4_25530 [soil metagenome]
MKARTFISVLLMFTLFGSAQLLTGQTGPFPTRKPSILSGRVFDRNGAVIVGSEVSLAGDRGARFGAVTNDEGIYSVDLPAGFYILQVRANGFSTFRLECYQIPSEGRVNLDVTLKVKDESGCESDPGKETKKPSPRDKESKPIV